MNPVRRFILSATDLLATALAANLVGWEIHSFYLSNGKEMLLGRWWYWVVVVFLVVSAIMMSWDFLACFRRVMKTRRLYPIFSITLLVTAGAMLSSIAYNYNPAPLLIGIVVLAGLYHYHKKFEQVS